MPISGEGWELHVVREAEQQRGVHIRTVGRYQVYHDGVPQPGTDMKGATAESKGPGANTPVNNGLRIESGRYPLWTQEPGRYCTWGYKNSDDPDDEPKPSFELKDTGDRTEILVHPGHEFLASVGCINLCTSLPNAEEDITFASSRRRVIAVLSDMKNFVGQDFPGTNGKKIPRAFVVVDGDS